MTVDNVKPENEEPIIQLTPVQGLMDYFCPFCNRKLFRGRVKLLNMVCDNCNRLVKESDFNNAE